MRPRMSGRIAAAMHVMTSSPGFTCANQAYVAYLSDDILMGGLPGSRKPGIGVELDPDRLEKYSNLYKEQGEFSPFS